MPATNIQLCLYDAQAQNTPSLLLIRKISMSGAESEDCCNVPVRELVKHQVQFEKTFLVFQEL